MDRLAMGLGLGAPVNSADRKLLANIVVVAVVAVWIASFLADMLIRAYDPLPAITPLMGSVVAFVFGGEFVQKRKENGG